MALPKTPPPIQIEDRIRALRQELDELIDAKANAVKAEMPGVPFLVCRNVITRNVECQCQAYLAIKDAEI